MIYITKDLNTQLDDFSKELGVSKSALIQLSVGEYLKAHRDTRSVMQNSLEYVLNSALEKGVLSLDNLKKVSEKL